VYTSSATKNEPLVNRSLILKSPCFKDLFFDRLKLSFPFSPNFEHIPTYTYFILRRECTVFSYKKPNLLVTSITYIYNT